MKGMIKFINKCLIKKKKKMITLFCYEVIIQRGIATYQMQKLSIFQFRILMHSDM